MTHVHTVHTDLIDSLDRPLNNSETVTTDSLHQESKRETDNNEIPGIETVEPSLTDPLQVAQIQSVIDGCKLCSFGIQNELGSMAITDIDGLALMHSRTGACMFKGLPTVPMASDEPNMKITCPACLKNEHIDLGELKASNHVLNSGCKALKALAKIFGYRGAEADEQTEMQSQPPAALPLPAPPARPVAKTLPQPPPPPSDSSAQTGAVDADPANCELTSKARPKDRAPQPKALAQQDAMDIDEEGQGPKPNNRWRHQQQGQRESRSADDVIL